MLILTMVIICFIMLLIITKFVNNENLTYYLHKNNKQLSYDAEKLIRIYQKCYTDSSMMSEDDWEEYEKLINQPLIFAQWELITNKFINTIRATEPYDPNKVSTYNYEEISTPIDFDTAYVKVFRTLREGRQFNAKHIKDVIRYTMEYKSIPYGVYLYNWRNGEKFNIDRYSQSCFESKEILREEVYEDLLKRKKNNLTKTNYKEV